MNGPSFWFNCAVRMEYMAIRADLKIPEPLSSPINSLMARPKNNLILVVVLLLLLLESNPRFQEQV